jgi:hypothetical protein
MAVQGANENARHAVKKHAAVKTAEIKEERTNDKGAKPQTHDKIAGSVFLRKIGDCT